MPAPTVPEIYAALVTAKESIDATLAAVELASPEILQPAEQVVHIAFDTAFAAVDVPTLVSALHTAAQVVKDGRGPTHGGPNATLA